LLSLRRQVDSLKSTQDEAQQQAELLKEETAGAARHETRKCVA
jgi:hypothetical protein